MFQHGNSSFCASLIQTYSDLAKNGNASSTNVVVCLLGLSSRNFNFLLDGKLRPCAFSVVALSTILFAFILRLIPELLSQPWPIGYDTIYYARKITEDHVWSNMDIFVENSPLFYILIAPFTAFDNIFVVLKAAAPLLYALLCGAVFTYASHGLEYGPKRALVCSLIFALQLSALRISWDLFRNELGLIFMLLTFALLARFEGTRIQFALFGLLSTLASFSHEMVAALQLLVILNILTSKTLNKEISWRKLGALIVTFSPSITYVIFLTFWALSSPVRGPVKYEVSPFFDYIGSGPYQYSTYMELITELARLFLILFSPVLSIVLLGMRKRLQHINSFTVILLGLSFLPVISPHCSPAFSPRWMFMLAIPFSFYAGEGLSLLYETSRDYRTIRFFIVLLVLPSLIFIALPPNLSLLSLLQTEKTRQYLPSSMLSNTVPLQDIPHLLESLAFLKHIMNSSSLLITHEAFYDWALIALGSHINVTSSIKLDPFAEAESFAGSRREIYVISWTDPLRSWHGLKQPDDEFQLVFSSGPIGIYRYRRKDANNGPMTVEFGKAL